MYLPKTKYKKGVAKAGEYMDLKTGKPYIGTVVETYNKEVYPGSIPSEIGPLLVPTNTGNENPTIQGVIPFRPTPTETDYVTGSFTRYFCKDLRTGKVVEIGKDNYKALLLEQRKTLKFISINWLIRGKEEDTVVGKYLYPGIRSHNTDTINQAEEELPGIKTQVLTDPIQYLK